MNWRDRLVEEHKELVDKLTKLEAFLDLDMTEDEDPQRHRILLIDQRNIMALYQSVLIKRLELIE